VTGALADVEREGLALIAALAAAGAPARLLGGVAIAQHRHAGWTSRFDRTYADIDLVAGSHAHRAVEQVLTERGYESAQPFNRLHGDRRLLFLDHAHARQVDVFLGRFAMCHALDLDARLDAHATTLAPADLLLTKLQVARPDPKDLRDAVALVHQHELGADADGDVLGVDRLVAVTSADWGWCTTVTDNLARLPEAADALLDAQGSARVQQRTAAIAGALGAAPKGLRWRARARVGRRVPWQEEPEEHGAGLHG
jgi:hypothetical protein